MFWFSRERRDPCFGHCVANVASCRKSRFTVGAEHGAERPENRVERSGAVSGRCRKTMERSGARSGGSRSGNGAGIGGYRIMLECGAAFSPAPLRSHALYYTILQYYWCVCSIQLCCHNLRATLLRGYFNAHCSQADMELRKNYGLSCRIIRSDVFNCVQRYKWRNNNMVSIRMVFTFISYSF